MKKLKYLFGTLLIMCVVVLVSCKDDEIDDKLQTLSVTAPIGTPYFAGADMYLVGDMNDWKVTEEFKMASFPYTVDSASTSKFVGRKYLITLTNLAQDTEYKYVVKVDGEEHMEVAAADGGVKGHANDIPNRVISNLKSINDTVANWKGITVDGQLAHKFTVTAPVVEGDVYMMVVDSLTDWEIDDAFKLNKDSDGKYSITLENMEDKTEYNYVLVVNGEVHIEMNAAPASIACAEAAEIRVIDLFNVRVNETVGNWKGITTCIPVPVPEE